MASLSLPAPLDQPITSLPWCFRLSCLERLLMRMSERTSVPVAVGVTTSPQGLVGFESAPSTQDGLVNVAEEDLVTERVLTSSIVKRHLMENSSFPPEDDEFASYFVRGTPEIAVTYSWKTPLIHVLQHLGAGKARRFDTTSADPLIWLDIFCINQNARDITQELRICDVVYGKAEVHAVLETQVTMQRTWCLHEVLLRSEAGKDSVAIDLPVHCCMGAGITDENLAGDIGLMCFRKYFDSMQATVPEDAEEIKRRILARMSASDFDRRIRIFIAQGLRASMAGYPSPNMYALKALELLEKAEKGEPFQESEIFEWTELAWKIPGHEEMMDAEWVGLNRCRKGLRGLQTQGLTTKEAVREALREN